VPSLPSSPRSLAVHAAVPWQLQNLVGLTPLHEASEQGHLDIVEVVPVAPCSFARVSHPPPQPGMRP
jgi:hypothetical protein